MHIHILGICGTFMGGIANIAVQLGHRVTGSDEHVYPPMSTQLTQLGIPLQEGYLAHHLEPAPDLVIMGNVLKRGQEAVEYVLNHNLPYQSGPEWLAQAVLKDKWVIAVAGTHGKTTTASMIAWILTYAGLEPGFLIGGVPPQLGVSAQLGKGPFFVIEADEYDTAFFDKRSKFIHYRPRTCLLNNLEFDHADIFENLHAIQKQCHHLVRTVPSNGAIITPLAPTLQTVLEMGCWSEIVTFGFKEGNWQAHLTDNAGSSFEIYYQNRLQGEVNWSLIGAHNVHNGLAAIVAAAHAGVLPSVAIAALNQFQPVKRRLEKCGEINGVTLYDDFAHHPTAIATTLAGMRAKVGDQQRLLAVVDIRSRTMCMGVHKAALPEALREADKIFVYQSPQVNWSVEKEMAVLGPKVQVFSTAPALLSACLSETKTGDHIIMMSNGAFENMGQRLLSGLKEVNNVA